MNKVSATIFATYLSGFCTTLPASDVNEHWVEGTCGEPATAFFVQFEMASFESQKIDSEDYMEEEEPSADGSVSPIW